jgi:hypothetical protein
MGGARQGGLIQTIDIAEQRALAVDLDGSYIFIQGPPGTGKTWTGGRPDHRADPARTTRRRRGDQPQGDPQPAGRGRRSRRAKKASGSPA